MRDLTVRNLPNKDAIVLFQNIIANYFLAWIEGFAILCSVMCVAIVGSFVDWSKEIQFVISRSKSDEKNIVT